MKKNLNLKTNTEYLTIREGESLYRDIWNVNPEYETDLFITHPFDKHKEVTFYSDIDSISFKVEPNKKYNFVLLINGKEAKKHINTSTKLKPTLQPKLFYRKLDIHSVNDTIPFKRGADNLIYIQGMFNDSDTLNFLLDLNAGSNVINEEVINHRKVSLKIDGNQDNFGSDGSMNIRTSSSNKMSINDLAWDNVPPLIIPYGHSRFDAVLSWRSFEDKILEIDYDKNILIILVTICLIYYLIIQLLG